MPTNDLWIAGSAMAHDCPLFTFDVHLSRIMNLKVVSKEAEWIALNS